MTPWRHINAVTRGTDTHEVHRVFMPSSGWTWFGWRLNAKGVRSVRLSGAFESEWEARSRCELDSRDPL